VATDAGGYDDASGSNGGSYTIGGDGDGPGSERWDVTALPDAGDTQIDVQLVGGGDDFWVATWVWAPGVAAPCEQAVGDADDDGFADWCDLCPGFDDALDADRDALPDGCELALGFLSPKSGPASGGAVSTLHGSGLDPSCAVAFDDVPAAAVTYLDATTILVEPPAHEPGSQRGSGRETLPLRGYPDLGPSARRARICRGRQLRVRRASARPRCWARTPTPLRRGRGRRLRRCWR
jgi:hypothetical protein